MAKTTSYEIAVNHRSDLLTQDLIFTGIRRHCRLSRFGFSFDYPLMRYEHATGNVLYPKEQIREIAEAEPSIATLRKVINALEKEGASYAQYLATFEKELRTTKKPASLTSEYFERSRRMAATIPYFVFERALERRLKREGSLGHEIPVLETDTTRATKMLAKIGKRYAKAITKGDRTPALTKELELFCQKYGYLGMKYYQGAPWSVEDAYGMLTKQSSGRKSPSGRSKKSATLDVAAQMLRMRTLKWELMCKGAFLFRQLAEKARPDVPFERFLDWRVSEALAVVDGARTPRRRGVFTLELARDGVIIEFGGKSSLIEHEIVGDVVRGVCAHPGLVRGRAKVVLTPADSKKVLNGDVLVATMSTPDFLPAMTRAAAFVTDIGGITCHAAIVAREMRKPCVIGTKNATEVFKDGDLVEVDAEKGIVRKVV